MAIAAAHEGQKFIPYFDPPGILTVCDGHTGLDVIKGRRYSLKECNDFLTADMHKAINAVERCQPSLPEPVLAAFADAVFNMGPTIACDTTRSTAARLLKERNFDAACNQLPRWNKAKVLGVLTELRGLTDRRNVEKELCLKWSSELQPQSYSLYSSSSECSPTESPDYILRLPQKRPTELSLIKNVPFWSQVPKSTPASRSLYSIQF